MPELHDKDDMKDILPIKEEKYSDALVDTLPPIKDWRMHYQERDISLLMHNDIHTGRLVSTKLNYCNKHPHTLPDYEERVTNHKGHDYLRYCLVCPKCVESKKIRNPLYMFTKEGMVHYWNSMNGGKGD